MLKHLIVLLFSFVVISCNNKEVPKKNSISKNQLEIQTSFKKINLFLQQSIDSLEFYATQMEKNSKNEPSEYQAMASIARAVFYGNKSQNELSFKSYEKAMELLANSKADSLKASTFYGIGNYYKHAGEFPKAFENLYKALVYYEKDSNKYGIASVNNSLGVIYSEKGDFDLAKRHLGISMKLLEKKKSTYSYLTTSHALANVYGMNGDYRKALLIDEEGLKICKTINSTTNQVMFLDNKANCFMYSGQLDSAKYYFDKCLAIDILAGNQKNIADSHSNLAELSLLRKNYIEAEKEINMSLNILNKIDFKSNVLKTYQILGNIYVAQGKYQLAYDNQLKYMTVYKKMMNEKKEASLAEYKIVHETQKKEKQLAENKIKILEQEVSAKNKNTTILILSILAVFIALFGFMIYYQQKLKSHQQEQEFELKTAISQIETQNKLQEQRLNISRDLHDNIGSQLTFIISSVENIKYAFDFKNVKLDQKLQSISSFTKDTILELRDTIWAMNNNEITFEELRSRILNFTEKAKEATGIIDFDFTIDERINNIPLTSIRSMNIYRTIQEAVNNAIKYAQASKITIDIVSNKNNIQITVRDNGKGFDPQGVNYGNGIENMKKRILDINGILDVNSELQKGTLITILIPNKIKY